MEFRHFYVISFFCLVSCTKKIGYPPVPIPVVDNSCQYKSNSVISYSLCISPILMANCMPCHSSPSAFSFDSYQPVKAAAQSGELIHAVMNDPNFVTMPPPPNKALDSCQIKALNLWLAQGCKNN
jgi:hypothetical protein